MLNYQLADNLTSRKISDEYFVLDRNNGMVHTFNDSGAFIWHEVHSNTPFDTIVQELGTVYGLSSESAKQDLFDFFLKLEKAGLLTLRE
jgi:hypothetical protein